MIGARESVVLAALALLANLGACSEGLGAREPSQSSVDALSCQWNEANTVPRPVPPERRPPPVMGPISEGAAQAKRLFDAERFAEAIRAFEPIVSGKAGSDEGERQIAEYHMAIAYYRIAHWEDAMILFARIAADPSHVKHEETLLWLTRLLDKEGQRMRALDAIYGYPATTIERFDNPQQRDLLYVSQYAAGRAALRRGDMATAETWFRKVPEKSPYFDVANDCLRFVTPPDKRSS